ncbi:MAG TPA: FKBP-type peptidyl-prolyl cis-trans isomerase [Chitinophagaceae bacterium]|jgi:FKBP-type peptidyl-prolyl cis-trans isomerase FkpA|nr:FKBP-type peptidyl-prolyl cis-trans isomerase [Chitinophagaceae bacterium]
MKTRLLGFLVCTIILSQTSCLKNNQKDQCEPKSVASEEPTIIAYASAKGINATKHSSGLYYEIVSPGGGGSPNINSKVFVTYIGKLLDGTIVDQQTNADKTGWYLSQLIAGWQIGLPLIQKGGSIKLIVPSSLAYGCDKFGDIPANSIVYFEIQLVDVQ